MQRQLDLRAAAAVLSESEDVTMADVAAHLGMAKPTLYRLAGSKSDLVRACVDAESERLLGHLHTTLGDAPFDDALRAMGAYAAESPGGFRLLFQRRGPDAEAAIERLEARLAELLAIGPRAPERPDLQAAALLGAGAAVVARLNPPVHASTGCRSAPAHVPTDRWW